MDGRLRAHSQTNEQGCDAVGRVRASSEQPNAPPLMIGHGRLGTHMYTLYGGISVSHVIMGEDARCAAL